MPHRPHGAAMGPNNLDRNGTKGEGLGTKGLWPGTQGQGPRTRGPKDQGTWDQETKARTKGSRVQGLGPRCRDQGARASDQGARAPLRESSSGRGSRSVGLNPGCYPVLPPGLTSEMATLGLIQQMAAVGFTRQLLRPPKMSQIRHFQLYSKIPSMWLGSPEGMTQLKPMTP